MALMVFNSWTLFDIQETIPLRIHLKAHPLCRLNEVTFSRGSEDEDVALVTIRDVDIIDMPDAWSGARASRHQSHL